MLVFNTRKPDTKTQALMTNCDNNFWTNYLCNSNDLTGSWWKGDCDACKDGKLFESAGKNSEKTSSVTWKMWEKDTSTGEIVQKVKEGCVGQLEDKIVSDWEFICFTAHKSQKN
ncbi:hypothetical protein PoB_004282200 [Plakobranchus ocellatus]|uniref:Uncharacterized protein n=1 Tax=Plakobranchus ocellatus TaxID=259542 RepID=A0AAV4BAY2_9GAST|nr:hypothetical protein PoB_004282200 [Plakobranchus ocellatus]